MKLSGKKALITGASQGLGKEIARAYLREGASVVICARDGELLKKTQLELSSELQHPDQSVNSMPCDVSSEAQVASLVAFAQEQLGSIDVLVNNAGVYGPMGPTESVELAAWVRTIEINLYGVLLPCRALIQQLKAKGSGKIIILSGGGATKPMPRISAYAASKAAVVRLMETLAEELAADKIDVNAVAPGALNTRMLDEALEAGIEKLGAETYARLIQQRDNGGAPMEKSAALCVYLASAESDGVTGKLLSAQWDPWENLRDYQDDLKSDIYTLRRIVPADRGKTWAS